MPARPLLAGQGKTASDGRDRLCHQRRTTLYSFALSQHSFTGIPPRRLSMGRASFFVPPVPERLDRIVNETFANLPGDDSLAPPASGRAALVYPGTDAYNTPRSRRGDRADASHSLKTPAARSDAEFHGRAWHRHSLSPWRWAS